MVNKIKNRLIFTNTFVLLVILVLMTSFIYVFASYSFSSRSEDGMINILYQAKRFSQNNFKSSSDYSYNEELSYLKERVNNEKGKLVYLDENYNILYKYGDLKVKDKLLKNISKAYFADETKSSDIWVKEEDGKYVFTRYRGENLDFDTCETVVADKSGNIRILLIAMDISYRNRTMSTLFYVLLLTILIGVGASIAGGYYTADRALVPIKNNIDAQKQFIADASHELRTPIAVIKTNLELIETNEDETVKSQEIWIDYAKSEAKRMDKIVGDLLTLSKADLNQIPFNLVESDILYLVKEAIEKIEPIAIKKEIRVYMASPYRKIIGNVDKDKFSQLLMILLDNAIKYSESKTRIMITIGINENKSEISISVKDQGIGIAKEDIDKIFTRFYRVDKARSRREKGSGLGLSIAKWIVDNHKGKIQVYSTLGEGTDVVIRLPLMEFEENEK